MRRGQHVSKVMILLLAALFLAGCQGETAQPPQAEAVTETVLYETADIQMIAVEKTDYQAAFHQKYEQNAADHYRSLDLVDGLAAVPVKLESSFTEEGTDVVYGALVLAVFPGDGGEPLGFIEDSVCCEFVETSQADWRYEAYYNALTVLDEKSCTLSTRGRLYQEKDGRRTEERGPWSHSAQMELAGYSAVGETLPSGDVPWQETVEITGVIGQIKAIGGDKYLLLARDNHQQIDGQLQPNDGLWVYDGTRERAQALDTGRGIKNASGQLFVQPGRVLYQDQGSDELMTWERREDGRLALAQTLGWQTAVTISPNMRYRAEQQDAERSLLIYDMQTEEMLFVLPEVELSGTMVWDETSAQVAAVADEGSSVVLWTPWWEDVQTFVTGEDLEAPEGWVAISDLVYVRDSRLLAIGYLCGSGTEWVIVDAHTGTEQARLRSAGELRILDTVQGKLLLAEETTDGSTLSVYDPASGQAQVLAQSQQRTYIAGCFTLDAAAVVVNSCEAAQQSNHVEQIAL